jgi:hypothetical protein
MPKKYFSVRLLSRRPTFPADITPEERIIMKQHAAYWIDPASVLTTYECYPMMAITPDNIPT